MRRYAVCGNPVSHSLSPWLHRYFASLTQRDIVYAAYSPTDFTSFANHFFMRAAGRGLNITVPFKALALEYADTASAFATKAGAANVLIRCDKGIVAYNTDGGGFIRDLRRYSSITDKTILLLGAGGAARAVACAIANENPAKFYIHNRTISKAEELATLTNAHVVEQYPIDADIVINATSAGHGQTSLTYPSSIFRHAHLAYDLSYGQAAVPFIEQAIAGGVAQAVDGRGMLVWQAALSFAIWEGVLPSVQSILNQIEAVQENNTG